MSCILMWFTPLLLCSFCSAQLTFTPTGYAFIQENLSDILLFNGTYVRQDASCTMKAVECQSSEPTIKLNTTTQISSAICTFNVTLLTPVDYEVIPRLNIYVTLILECSGTETRRYITKVVVIENLKDTPPAFQNSTYRVSIPENHPVNTAVIRNIQAIDPDGFDSVNYTVNFLDQEEHLFQVRLQSIPEILDIYLISPLDFEQQHVHRFTITAMDSVGMTGTCEVLVKVINIQDKPPAFTAMHYNGRIYEQAPVGTIVLTVTAIDGDNVLTQDQGEGTTANQIYYSIINGDVGMFGINSTTGEIMSVRELDIDSNNNVTNGLVVLTIMATELNTSTEPQFGASSVTVLALVQIEDANDNRPQFNSESFIGNIRADAALGEFITIERGGYISVFDIDQAPSNNHFSLHIEKDGQPWDVFKPNIESQYAYASVMIQLSVNNSLSDLGDTHVRFQIVAQEYGSSHQNFTPTKAEITLWVKAHVAAVTPSGPIIDLPLSTSDIIVFVVGLLLLLNIGMTVFVCYALRGGRGYSSGIFQRNSKYNVSKRNKTNPESDDKNDDDSYTTAYNDGIGGNTNAAKMKTSQWNLPETNIPVQKAHEKTEKNTNTTQFMKADILAANRNGVEKALSTNRVASQIISKPGLMDVSKKNGSSNRDVKHTESSSTQETCTSQFTPDQTDHHVNGNSNFEQGASNFMQGVLHLNLANGTNHITTKNDYILDLQREIFASIGSSRSETPTINSNNSSSSETRTEDGVPLIKSSKGKHQGDLRHFLVSKNPAHGPADLPDTSETVHESDELKTNSRKSTVPSAIETETVVSGSLRKSEDSRLKKSVAFNPEDKKVTPYQSLPGDSNIRSDSRIHPNMSQITQTGVPPIALALPLSTGSMNNKPPHFGIINPFFGTQTTVDSLPASPTLVSTVSGLTSTI